MTTSSEPRARFPQYSDFLGRYVRLLSIHMMREVDAGTAQSHPDVTPGMKQALMYVDIDGSRLTDLASQASMTKQAMMEHVDALVTLGYLERIPDPRDGRAKLIRPTAVGKRSMRDALMVARGVHGHWVDLLGERKAAQLQDLLRELVEALDAEQAADHADVG